jgi:ubiquinone/menaquinone biosynthesis C-methylase UbiE
MDNLSKISIIIHNKKAHDKVFKTYNLKHHEIYNKYEQERLMNLIPILIGKVNTSIPKVLDVGAGTGNLSLKFLQFNCKVFASDVSSKSLELLKELSNNNQNLNLVIIKDENLPFEDNSFDIVCTYSVLHHIPDYLRTVKEMIRVVKPEGYIYIDHEANRNKYYPDKFLSEYYSFVRQTLYEHVIKLIKTRELFSFNFARGAFIKLFLDAKYQREGDIHVWKDDRIDWFKIKEIAKENNCEIFQECDYLMYAPKGGTELYNKYKDICNDTKFIIFKK